GGRSARAKKNAPEGAFFKPARRSVDEVVLVQLAVALQRVVTLLLALQHGRIGLRRVTGTFVGRRATGGRNGLVVTVELPVGLRQRELQLIGTFHTSGLQTAVQRVDRF